MTFTMDLEVVVTFEEIGEEAHAAFECHQSRGKWKQLDLSFDKATVCFFDLTPGEVVEDIKVELDYGKILFIFSSSVGDRANCITEIVEG